MIWGKYGYLYSNPKPFPSTYRFYPLLFVTPTYTYIYVNGGSYKPATDYGTDFAENGNIFLVKEGYYSLVGE